MCWLMAMERTKKKQDHYDCLLGVYLNVNCEVQSVAEATTSGERNNKIPISYRYAMQCVRVRIDRLQLSRVVFGAIGLEEQQRSSFGGRLARDAGSHC